MRSESIGVPVHRFEEWVIGLEQELGAGREVGPAADPRPDAARPRTVGRLEPAPGKTFLAVDFAGGERAVGRETGQAGAGSGTAGRTIIGQGRTEHEVSGIRISPLQGSIEFDVVDGSPSFSRDAQVFEGLPDRPGIGLERLAIVGFEWGRGRVGDEKPVAAPGDVTRHGAMVREDAGDRLLVAITFDIVDRDRSVGVQFDVDWAHRGLDPMVARLDPVQGGQGMDQTDRSVSAHAERAATVRIEDAGCTGRVGGRGQEGQNGRQWGTGLGREGEAESPEIVVQSRTPFRERAPAEIREAVQDDTGRLATRMGICDFDLLHPVRLARSRRKGLFGVGRSKADSGIIPPVALQQISLADLERLFDAFPDVVFFVKDRAGRYRYANETLVRRLRREQREQIIGKRASELFPVILAQRYETQDKAVLAGRIITDELELHLYPDHAPGWCLSTKRPLRVNGEIGGLIGVSRDLGRPDVRHPGYARLQRMVGWLSQHYGEPIVFARLADEVGLSLGQLERLCRRVFNLSPRMLLTKIRIHQSMVALAEGRTVAEVAQASGYGDQSAFSRRFRAFVGLSPRDYQRLAGWPARSRSRPR